MQRWEGCGRLWKLIRDERSGGRAARERATGTGFARAKLSEVPPPVAFAPVVGMTKEARVARRKLPRRLANAPVVGMTDQRKGPDAFGGRPFWLRCENRLGGLLGFYCQAFFGD
jgi:hypothetical protein